MWGRWLREPCLLSEGGRDPVVGVDASARPRKWIASTGHMTMPFPGFHGDSGPVCEESPKVLH